MLTLRSVTAQNQVIHKCRTTTEAKPVFATANSKVKTISLSITARTTTEKQMQANRIPRQNDDYRANKTIRTEMGNERSCTRTTRRTQTTKANGLAAEIRRSNGNEDNVYAGDCDKKEKTTNIDKNGGEHSNYGTAVVPDDTTPTTQKFNPNHIIRQDDNDRATTPVTVTAKQQEEQQIRA